MNLTILRRASLAALFVAALFSMGGVSVEAQLCPPNPTAYGTCASKLVTTPNDFPFAVTVIGSEQKVLVADFLPGAFHKYDQLDLAATPPTSHPAPLGATQITGVAWHPTLDELFWILQTGGADRFVRSTLDGTLISNTPIVGATAEYAGLTWNPGSSSFWTLDFRNDTYVELDVTGTVTGNTFTIPFSSPFGGLAFGLGLTAVEDPVDGWQFDVPWGSPDDFRTARVERVTPNGTPVGLGYDLSAANEATGWITGIAWAPIGSTGAPVTFVVDFTEGRLIELPTPSTAPRTIHGLTCDVTTSGDVTLTWTNGQPYTSIEIERDGVNVGSLTGSSALFVESSVPAGTAHYRLTPTDGGVDLPARECAVVVGRGLPLLTRPFDGEGAFGVTVIESLNRIVVTELLGGTAHFYDKDLVPDGTVLPSPFTGGDATTGIAWNSVDDTLLWHSGDTGALQFTDLTGALDGPGFALDPLPVGVTGDISYSAATGTYFGVRTDTSEVFEFDSQGIVLGTCPTPQVDGAPGAASRGVAVALSGANEVLDLAIGPASSGRVDRVLRLDGCTPDGTSYDVGPTTGAGVIAGVAYTPIGSNGIPSEYVIGFDTNRIYEVDLDAAPPVDPVFRRGDMNLDSALDISDPTALLAFLFLGSDTFTIGGVIRCEDAADANDSGSVDLADAVEVLNFLFIGGVSLPDPQICGTDPTPDALGCLDYPICL